LEGGALGEKIAGRTKKNVSRILTKAAVLPGGGGVEKEEILVFQETYKAGKAVTREGWDIPNLETLIRLKDAFKNFQIRINECRCGKERRRFQ